MITSSVQDVIDLLWLLDDEPALVALDDSLDVWNLVGRHHDEPARMLAHGLVLAQRYLDPARAAAVGALAHEAAAAVKLALRLSRLVDLAEATLVGRKPLCSGGHRREPNPIREPSPSSATSRP